MVGENIFPHFGSRTVSRFKRLQTLRRHLAMVLPVYRVKVSCPLVDTGTSNTRHGYCLGHTYVLFGSKSGTAPDRVPRKRFIFKLRANGRNEEDPPILDLMGRKELLVGRPESLDSSFFLSDRLRQPDNLRWLSIVGHDQDAETHGFATPPRGRVCLYRCNRECEKNRS